MADEKKLRFPTVHLNGTSRAALARENKQCADALHLAIEAIKAAEPNARDYYLQGPGAYEQAKWQHMDRLAHVSLVYCEYMQVLDSLESGQ